MEILGIPFIKVVLSCVIVFFTGIIRGFSGFGFALATVPLLTTMFDPSEVIPCACLLGIIGSLQLLPKIKKDVDWHVIKLMILGYMLGFPFGYYILTTIPANGMRIVIGSIVIIAVILIAKGGIKTTVKPSSKVFTLIGTLSGGLGGSTGLDGPPVIVYFLSRPEEERVGRASLLVYFLFGNTVAFLGFAILGSVNSQTFALSTLIVPGFMLGGFVGDKMFDKAKSEVYRKVALILISLMAVVAIIKSLISYL